MQDHLQQHVLNRLARIAMNITLVSAPMGFGSLVVPSVRRVGMLLMYWPTVGVSKFSSSPTLFISPPPYVYPLVSFRNSCTQGQACKHREQQQKTSPYKAVCKNKRIILEGGYGCHTVILPPTTLFVAMFITVIGYRRRRVLFRSAAVPLDLSGHCPDVDCITNPSLSFWSSLGWL